MGRRLLLSSEWELAGATVCLSVTSQHDLIFHHHALERQMRKMVLYSQLITSRVSLSSSAQAGLLFLLLAKSLLILTSAEPRPRARANPQGLDEYQYADEDYQYGGYDGDDYGAYGEGQC